MIPIVKLAGIECRVHWLVLLLVGLSAFWGYGHIVLIIMGSLFFHELAHIIAARFLNIRVKAIELTPFGGQAQIEDFTVLEPNKEIPVALAGPVSSLGLAAFFYFLPDTLDQPTALWLIGTNLFLGLFNLLPALPMDGGRILRSILSPIMGFRRATRLGAFLGIIFSLAIMCHGALYAADGTGNAWEFMVGVVLLWFAVRESRFLAYSLMRCLIHKKSELNRHGFLESRQLISSLKTPVKALLKDTRPKFYLTVMAIDDSHHIVGIYTEAELIECLVENGPEATLRHCRTKP